MTNLARKLRRREIPKNIFPAIFSCSSRAGAFSFKTHLIFGLAVKLKPSKQSSIIKSSSPVSFFNIHSTNTISRSIFFLSSHQVLVYSFINQHDAFWFFLFTNATGSFVTNKQVLQPFGRRFLRCVDKDGSMHRAPALLCSLEEFFDTCFLLVSATKHSQNAIAAQKDLMIDFHDSDYDVNDIQTLTDSMNNLEEHLISNNHSSTDSTTNRASNAGGSRGGSFSECTSHSFDTSPDISSFVRERDYILRRMESTARTRSKSKCVGDAKIRSAPLLPCLGFHDCMMIQDD